MLQMQRNANTMRNSAIGRGSSEVSQNRRQRSLLQREDHVGEHCAAEQQPADRGRQRDRILVRDAISGECEGREHGPRVSRPPPAPRKWFRTAKAAFPRDPGAKRLTPAAAPGKIILPARDTSPPPR
jgi:hypothetical protein